MYKRLLISAGGGIISRDQQAEQANCATIAIGLGGTGIACLRALKKEVYNRLKPDDPTATVPIYRHIKFLAVDTDRGSLGSTGAIDTIDDTTEFLDLSCADINGLLKKARVLRQNPALKWLKTTEDSNDSTGLEIQNAQAGAGGVRQIGRLLLMQSCAAFIQKLTGMINSARADMSNAPINIHIYTGLGGGTGSGTFLDVCYLTQYIIDNLGITNAQTCGYFFLPDVNLNRVPTEVIQRYIKVNGFAAMKELDYCMNFANNGDEWNQTYSGFSIRTQERPVQLAHIISAADSAGDVREKGYDYAMRVAVDYTMEFIVKPFIPENMREGDDGVFSLNSHIANFYRVVAGVRKTAGACYYYAVLGASNTYLPYKNINTYLAAKIFENFSNLGNQLPDTNAINDFIAKNGLRYEDISRGLSDRAPGIAFREVSHGDLYDAVQGISADVTPGILKMYEQYKEKAIGAYVANMNALLDELEEAAFDSTISGVHSLITAVKKGLISKAALAVEGPFYAAAILSNNTSVSLKNTLRGYATRCSEELAQAVRNRELRIRTIEDTLLKLQNANAFNKKGRAEEYNQAERAYYDNETKIKFLNMLADVISKFSVQVDNLYSRYFNVFASIISKLQDTFKDNLRTLATPVGNSNDFETELISVVELKESLDNTVKAMDKRGLIEDFLTNMLRKEDCWLGQDEIKICHEVTEHFLRLLTEFTQKTLTNYLEIKFDTNEPGELVQKTFSEIIQPLGEKSAPLFWHVGYYNPPIESETGYCSIPNGSDIIAQAANRFHAANQSISVRRAAFDDRITLLRIYCGVPMFGYMGAENYKAGYRADKEAGKHIYESAADDPRDFTALPNITPFSCINDGDRGSKLVADSDNFDRALKLGVILMVARDDETDATVKNVDYKIINIDEASNAALLDKIDKAITAGDAVAAQKIAQSEEFRTPVLTGFRSIRNSGAEGYEDLAIKDHVLGSPILRELIARQLEMVDGRNAAVERLNEYIKNYESSKASIPSFAEALYTGIICRAADSMYRYEVTITDEFGLPDVKVLSNMDSQPFGERVPLYSMFLGYMELSDADKDSIKKEAMSRKQQDVNAIVDSLKNAHNMVSEQAVTLIIKFINQYYPDKINDVKQFIKQLKFEIDSYIEQLALLGISV